MKFRIRRARPELSGFTTWWINHATVREAIASSFKREAGFEVLGGGSLKEARPMLEEVDVAVVALVLLLSKLGLQSRVQGGRVRRST